MLNIINYFRGSVRVELTSEFPERFINICAQNNIALWEIERGDNHTLRVSMRGEGFRKAQTFTHRGIGQIRLVRRMGLPNFLLRYKKRYALMASVLLMVAALTALSMFIWEIDVSGNENISKEVILQELNELGIGIGTYRKSFKPKDIQNQMLIKIPELEWLAVNVTGSYASVEVREKEPKPIIVPENEPCNIVSEKAGLIVAINTLEGSASVKVGEAVEAGQLLVSGLINSNVVGVRQVHAMAEVTARTWYEYTSVLPVNATGKKYTGRERTRNAIILAGFRINLFWDNPKKTPVMGTEKTVKRSTLKLGERFTLPLVWVTETLTEYEPVDFTVSYGSADAFMKYALGLRLDDESQGAEILSADFATLEQNGVYRCDMAAECLESIAKTVGIQ